jgi:predicted nucleotide-binding protein/predicted ester cyclase
VGGGRQVLAAGIVVLTIAAGLAGSVDVGAQDATPAAPACPVTTPDENKEVVRRYLDEAYNARNPDAAELYLADDFTRNTVARPHANEPGNADDVQRVVENLQDFPDLQLTIDDVLSEGDMAAVRFTWSGTHSDAIDAWNAPATGKPTTFWGMAFYRVECGLLAEQWVILDYFSMAREVGIVSDQELTTIGESAPATPASAPTGTPEPEASQPRPERPRIFIGSSVEGLPIAEAIEFDLQFFADVTIWDQGVFHLSQGTLAALTEAAANADFAILVLTADDVTTRRGQTLVTARDNVIFELGFFMGYLGPERTYIVYSRDNSPILPSDLAGVTVATFAERADGNMDAAVGPATIQIKRAMEAVLAAEE